MDNADKAQDFIDMELAAALSKQLSRDVVESDFCEDCGIEIPKARKLAVRTNVCVDCAEISELQQKHYVTR